MCDHCHVIHEENVEVAGVTYNICVNCYLLHLAEEGDYERRIINLQAVHSGQE